MRAETEKQVAEIEKSLELLRQRMGWETAAHRMEEFDAMSEDPTLWDNPEKAQKLMRERQNLVDAMDNYKSLAGDLQDNVDMIELGEMEDDAEVVTDAEGAISDLKLLPPSWSWRPC